MHEENGRITETHIGPERHGILTATVTVTLASGGSIGMPCWAVEDNTRLPRLVAGLLRVARVEKWEKLRGAFVRVRMEGPHGPLLAIGHIIEPEWFELRDLQPD